MSEVAKPQIRAWMVIVGVIVSVLAFLQFRAGDQETRDLNACLAGDYSRCEPIP